MSDQLDPIELQFILNSPELLAEFQKIIAAGGDVDEALSKMKQKYEEVKSTQKESGKQTTELKDLMKQLGGEIILSGGKVDVLADSLGDFAGEVVQSGNGIKILTKIKEGWLWVTGGLTRGIMALGVAEGAATIATQVLLATITLGLTVAIGGLIVLISKSTEKLREQAEVNKKVAESVAEPIAQYKNLQNQWNALGNDLATKEKFILDNQKAFEKLGFSVNNVGEAENFFVKRTSDVIQSLILRAKAAAAMQMATEKYKEALQAQMDYESKMDIMKNGNFFEKIWTMKDANFGSWDNFGNLINKQNKANEAAYKWANKSYQYSYAEQNTSKGMTSGGKKLESPLIAAMQRDNEVIQARFGTESSQYINHTRKLLQTKINYYKNDKAEFAKYQQELKLFEAAQYKRAEDDAKKSADERARKAEIARNKELARQQQYDEKVKAFQAKISQKETELYNKSDADTSESAKINTYFDQLEKEAKALKVNQETYTKINLLREAYLSNAKYKEETKQLLTELDQQRELYQAFETLKTKISESEAVKRLGINYSEFQTYGQKLDEEIKKLTAKANRSVEENVRLKELQDRKTTYTTDQKQQDTNKFAEAYQATITHREQIESINKQYDSRALQLQLIADESLRNAKLAENERQRQETINSANAEAYERTAIFQRLSDNILNITKRELALKIIALQNFLATAKNLTPEQKQKISADLSTLKSLQAQTNIGVYQNALLERKKTLIASIQSTNPKSIEQALAEQQQLAEVNEELKKTVALKAQMFADKAAQLGGAFKDMASAIGDSNEGLADTLDTAGDLMNVASSAAGAFASFASGDIIGGITGVMKTISGIFSISKKAKESERKAREEMKKREAEQLQAQLDYNSALRQRLVDEVKINDLYKSRVDNIKEEQEARKKAAADNLKDQQMLLNKLLGMSTVVSQYTKKYGGFLGIGRKTKVVDVTQSLSSLLGISLGTPITDDIFKKLEEINAKAPLTGDAKTAYEQLKKLRDEYGSIADAQAELEKQLKDAVTGNTAQSFADGIIEGIKNGKKSFADFANDIEGYLRNALIAGMSAKVIEPEMQKLQDALYEMMGDGILSADERKTFQDMYMKVVSSSQEYMDMINQAGVNISTSTSSANSLSGAIKGASQESIDLLGGQFGGMRMAQLEGNQILKTGFSGMMEQTSKMVQLQIDIEKNTRKTAENTEKLHDVNDNVEKVVDGQEKHYKALQAAGIIK